MWSSTTQLYRFLRSSWKLEDVYGKFYRGHLNYLTLKTCSSSIVIYIFIDYYENHGHRGLFFWCLYSLQGSPLTCAATLEARPSLSVYLTTGRFSRETPATPPPDPSRLLLKLGNAKVWKRASLPLTTTWTNCKHWTRIIKNTKWISKPYPVGTLNLCTFLKIHCTNCFDFQSGAETKFKLLL